MPDKIMKNKKYIIVFIFLLAIASVCLFAPEITAEDIMSYTPENLFAATLFMMAVYFVKSLILPAPSFPLQVAAGYLFPLPLAVAISLVGASMTMAIQYAMGMFAGAEIADKLMDKYPKFNEFIGLQKEHSFFLCFLLRFFAVLPGSVATLYFGATRTRFSHSMTAGFIGVFPSTVLATMIEPWMENFTSPEYWILAGAMIIMMAVFAVAGIKFREML